MTESGRRRVEQKGRFTITEIIPGSPSSAQLSSLTFLDDEMSIADFSTVDVALPTGDSCSEMAPLSLQQAPVEPSETVIDTIVASNARTTEKSLDGQPHETVSAPSISALTSAAEAEGAAVSSVSEVFSPLKAELPSQKYTSPKKMAQRIRRIKRRGRFTIIEMTSDSPTSRKNTDDVHLDDHRCVSVSAIGGTSASSAPQQGSTITRSADNLGRLVKPKRATRSMPRLRQTSSNRRSRRRSESPTREVIKAVDIMEPRNSLQQQQGFTKLQVQPELESSKNLNEAPMTNAIRASAAANVLASTSGAACRVSVASSDNEFASTIRMPSTRQVSTCSQPMTTHDRVSKPQQNSLIISTAQFLQQEETIASLIQQQCDLKQIISVLQEQQQQLMIIPSHIQKVNFNIGEIQDEQMRKLSLKVDALTAANESLHSMINAADREARHRALEIECLSEENDELRHRYGQLETRYMEERKQSFVLEEELQRVRSLSVTLQKLQFRQQQQLGQKA
ncbi:hypothetical protein CCR75_004957 [Bremia lactucae]|uniref:Uncharacterized protein n=1 Tax=Bremia lactucae TaxID=4779 RepID=A0A976FEK0_BRELC|nr:hypothetical protein CCR75_004957 [Bremia lactucae]